MAYLHYSGWRCGAGLCKYVENQAIAKIAENAEESKLLLSVRFGSVALNFDQSSGSEQFGFFGNFGISGNPHCAGAFAFAKTISCFAWHSATGSTVAMPIRSSFLAR